MRMPIEISNLRMAASRYRSQLARNLTEARQGNVQTAFLCHSHKDEVLVEGLIVLLQEAGWHVYVDWKDASMPETPNKETARNIRHRIEQSNYFLFLATPNSLASRWCPWEIGVADGRKAYDNIFVIPTRNGNNHYGNEYVELYRRIDLSVGGKLATWMPSDFNDGRYLSSF